jgi:hypothetical protein
MQLSVSRFTITPIVLGRGIKCDPLSQNATDSMIRKSLEQAIEASIVSRNGLATAQQH